ncbi:MAG: outer membrane lipoprotein [Alteromonadaceae bacterium]|jgi:outer membrane lipoprotein
MKILILSLSAILLCACSSIPKKLQLPEVTNLAALSAQQSNKGEYARWGGVIADVKNNADNTMIEVVSFTLTSSTRPKPSTETQGRFRLYYAGLLDPVIYQKGRSITAIGTVKSAEEGKIGDHQYKFPVLKASHVHLWKNIQRIDVNVIPDPFMYSPYHWRSPLLYRHNRPIIIHGKSSTNQSGSVQRSSNNQNQKQK